MIKCQTSGIDDKSYRNFKGKSQRTSLWRQRLGEDLNVQWFWIGKGKGGLPIS